MTSLPIPFDEEEEFGTPIQQQINATSTPTSTPNNSQNMRRQQQQAYQLYQQQQQQQQHQAAARQVRSGAVGDRYGAMHGDGDMSEADHDHDRQSDEPTDEQQQSPPTDGYDDCAYADGGVDGGVVDDGYGEFYDDGSGFTDSQQQSNDDPQQDDHEYQQDEMTYEQQTEEEDGEEDKRGDRTQSCGWTGMPMHSPSLHRARRDAPPIERRQTSADPLSRPPPNRHRGPSSDGARVPVSGPQPPAPFSFIRLSAAEQFAQTGTLEEKQAAIASLAIKTQQMEQAAPIRVNKHTALSLRRKVINMQAHT